MPSVNERLLDAGVRHQVGIQRLSAGITRRVSGVFGRADDKVTRLLAERTATLTGDLRSQRLVFLQERITEINKAAATEMGAILRQELRDLAKYEVGFQQQMLGRAVPWAELERPDASRILGLVTNEPMQGRYLKDWLKDLERERTSRIMAAVRSGMNQGVAQADIVAAVRGTRALGFRDGVFARNNRHVGNLSRLATNTVASKARTSLFEANDDIIAGELWVATLEISTCEECAGYDGTVFPVGEGPEIPVHPNCMCTRVPVIRSARALGVTKDEIGSQRHDELNGRPAEPMRFERWLRSQSASEQDKVLGPTRGKLFRQSGLPVSRFTDARGNTITLDQLQELEAEAFARAGF